ncbi:MAG: cytochrome c [Candidatus Thiodiazotropha endolucinida]|nr:cytochrome c [Candidatus Thiodiazotropha endolucinida]
MVLTRNRFVFISLVGISGAVLTLAGCEKPQEVNGNADATWGGPAMPANMPVKQRWYTQDQVNRGNTVYQTNCATCHKPDASGTKDWKTPLDNGKYPPPPINGDAHAWHHPLKVLRRVVNKGGVPLGGWMPAFGEKLSNKEVDDVLAWVQSNWSDEIYSVWYERNEQSR